MIDPKFTSPVSGFLYINEENEIPVSLSGSNISLTLCDRTGTTDSLGNYFVSLNLPPKESDFPKNSSLSFFYPELQQLNVDKILLLKIPNTAYTEYIDARSIKLNVPVNNNYFSENIVTLFSSTYEGVYPDKYGERSPLLGDNIAYLFCDSINIPYTGSTVNDLGMIISHSANISWNPISRLYEQRPSAVSYGEVKLSNNTINTDRRNKMNKAVFTDGLYPDYRGKGISFYSILSFPPSSVIGYVVKPDQNYFKVGDSLTVDLFLNTTPPCVAGFGYPVIISISSDTSTNKYYQYSPDPNYGGPWDIIYVSACNPGVITNKNQPGYIFESGGTYYNYDIPVGFAVLDKGLIAITHPYIVDSIDWSSGYLSDGTSNSLSATTNIYFDTTDTTIYGDTEPVCQLDFSALDTVFKLRTTCNTLVGQYYISNNSTWDNALALNPFSTNQPVSITEVGLYNELNELVAVSKFSEPVYKTAFDIFTFEIDINL
jgi:hypothetical protein